MAVCFVKDCDSLHCFWIIWYQKHFRHRVIDARVLTLCVAARRLTEVVIDVASECIRASAEVDCDILSALPARHFVIPVSVFLPEVKLFFCRQVKWVICA